MVHSPLARHLDSLPGVRTRRQQDDAWYASARLITGAVQAARHMRREAVARGVAALRRQVRQYSSRAIGAYPGIRGRQAGLADVYTPDSYAASQLLGEKVRADGRAGILYGSIRHAGGVNIAVHRPRNLVDVVQADHYEIRVAAANRRIGLRKLQ
jgi:hypothetical protein